MDLRNNLEKIIYAYAIGSMGCDSLLNDVDDYNTLLDEIKKLSREKGILSYVEKAFKEYKAKGIAEHAKECLESKRIIEETSQTIDRLYEIVADDAKLVKVAVTIAQQLGSYVNKVSGNDELARYEKGKLTAEVLALFIGTEEVSAAKKMAEFERFLARAAIQDVEKIGTKVAERTGKVANSVVSKFKVLAKLDDLPNAKAFVNSLDDVADAILLNRLDNLTTTQLDNLNTFYKNRPSPAGFSKTDFNFTATKTINGQPVSITYKNGFPDFYNTTYCPTMSYPNGTSSKFKFQSNSLIGSGTDFGNANEALLNKFGILKGSQKNANGFYETSNYRWNGTSSQFELKNARGTWEKYTWHHLEDGKTMIPVLSNVHSGPLGGFVHPGGNAIIQNGIKDIFELTGY